jgi:hypothetical protein
MTTWSLRSRRALEETKEATVINVERENSVISGGEVNKLDLRSVSGGEQQEELGQNWEKDLSSKILGILHRLGKLDLETSKRLQDISSLQEEAQQRIQNVNSKFSSLINGFFENLELQMSETKQHHTEMFMKIHDNKKEVDSKFNNMQSEIVNLRQELIVDSFCVLEDKLEAKINELLEGRLGQFESHLDQLSGKVTAVYGIYRKPSVGSELNQVHDAKDIHARSIPTSVPSANSKSQTDCKCENNNNKHSVNGCAGAETNLGTSKFTCKNDVVVGDAHFRSSVVSDLTLPKFSDCKRQHIVNFLEELDSYFQLKDAPAEMRLPIAMKSITGEYTQQWVVTINKELRSYDHFQQAITELLWRPQIQSQVRCSISQDRFNKSGDESLSAHFLQYTMMAANLTPKMSELEINDAIGGHYPNYIQHALLSANVKTIQEDLRFLNKLQIMEDSETRKSSSREPPMSRPEHSSSAGQNQNGHYRPRTQPQNIRYTRYTENSSYDQNRQYNQHSSGRELQTASLQRRRRSQLNTNADLYSPKRMTNNSHDRNARSEISGHKNFRQSM